MRAASALLAAGHPELEIDGEMHGDTALDPMLRERVFPHSRLQGQANVLIMPNLDAANIAFQMIKTIADALPVGPILIGTAKPAHILSPSVHGARCRQHDGGCGRRSAGEVRGLLAVCRFIATRRGSGGTATACCTSGGTR